MDAARASVAAAQAAARRGDSTAAREHLEAAIASADSEVRRFRRVAGAVAAGLTSAAAAGDGDGNGSDDGGVSDGTRRSAPDVALQEALHTRGEAQLALAEMLWQQGEKPLALRSYEGALDAARGAGDSGREGMISLGMGYALLNSADPALLPTALKAMRRSKELAQEQGHNAQVTFVESLIVQAEERQRAAAAADEEEEAAVQPLRTEEEEQAAMLAAFVQSLVRRSPIMLFLKGTALKPTCGFSLAAARQLMALEVDFSDVDVGADAQLRDAVKKFAQWPTFPQLWVGGQLLGGHDILKELGAEEDADGVGGGGGGLLAAIDAQLLSTAAGEGASGVLRREGPPGGAGGQAAALGVSHSCACIGSPCLRHCVHGASIGSGGGGGG
jgi:monothiol glutaredoxin